MPDFDPGSIQVLAFDIFGTTVDWRTGVAEQVAQIACPGRKLGYRFWPGLSRSGPALVEQSAETLPASDRVDSDWERDRVRFVVGSTQTHPVALVAAPGVVMGDVDVEYVA